MAEINTWKVERIAWFDCESTGNDPERDLLLEVACILTDADLRPLAREACVIHYERDVLEAAMWRDDRPLAVNELIADMHEKSGLWADLVRPRGRCPIDGTWGPNELMADAERLMINTVGLAAGPGRTVLGGCSPWLDRSLLRKNMPSLYTLLSHRTIDASALKMALVTWGEQEIHKARESKHRAMDDVVDAIRLAGRARSFIRHGARLMRDAREQAALEIESAEIDALVV